MRKYFYTDGKEKFGPFSKEDLMSQNIPRNTKVWCYGMDNWTEMANIPELTEELSALPPEITLKTITKNSKENREPHHALKKSNRKNSTNKPFTIALLNKILIAFVVLVVASLLIHSAIKDRSKDKFYDEIVANSYETDENFNMYVDKFYRDLEYYGIFPRKPKTTTIKFSKLDELENTTHIHGISFGGGDDERIEVYINPSSWKQFNKPMRYYLIYHELAHDILNLEDLEPKPENAGKIMYPEISNYENKNMDDFIESFHALFEELSMK